MNKTVVKVVGIHALIVGGFAAAATIIVDLKKIYLDERKTENGR